MIDFFENLQQFSRTPVREWAGHVLQKIIDYHKKIKDGCLTLESSGLLQSRRAMLDLTGDISSARGEMVYALSFTRLLGFPDEYTQSVEGASKSFGVLNSRVEAILSLKAHRFSRGVGLLTLLVTFFGTYYAVLKEPTGRTAALIVSIGASIGVCLLMLLIDWLISKRK